MEARSGGFEVDDDWVSDARPEDSVTVKASKEVMKGREVIAVWLSMVELWFDGFEHLMIVCCYFEGQLPLILLCEGM